MNKNLKRSLVSYLILFALILGVLYLVQGGNKNVNLKYTETNFAQDMEDGNVKSVSVQQNAEVPTGTVEMVMKDRSVIRIEHRSAGGTHR